MDRNELMEHLAKYGDLVNNRTAKTTDFVDIKNKIRQAYDAGNLDKESMKQIADKASGAFKNMGKSPELEALPRKILEKGGTVSGVEGMKGRFPTVNKALGVAEDVGTAVREDTGGLLKNKAGFSKVLPMLGMGAAALGALGIANKVQAGELGQAGLESADLATDYVPGIAQAKMLARPSELGNAELPDELMKERELYNAARRSKDGEQVNNPSSEQPLLAPEDRATYDEMKKKINFNVLNRLK